MGAEARAIAKHRGCTPDDAQRLLDDVLAHFDGQRPIPGIVAWAVQKSQVNASTQDIAAVIIERQSHFRLLPTSRPVYDGTQDEFEQIRRARKALAAERAANAARTAAAERAAREKREAAAEVRAAPERAKAAARAASAARAQAEAERIAKHRAEVEEWNAAVEHATLSAAPKSSPRPNPKRASSIDEGSESGCVHKFIGEGGCPACMREAYEELIG